MAYKPTLTNASRQATFPAIAIDETGAQVPVEIAGEHPLTLYLDKREIVTLMTLGDSPEALIIGYLRNQRLVKKLEDIVAVQVDWETNAVAVTTNTQIDDLDERLGKRTVTTGCGQGTVFGDVMEDISHLTLPNDVMLSNQTLYALLENLRHHDTLYKKAGALHSCALAKDSEILYHVEDVGRHNAVDAIAGFMWLDEVNGGDKIFYTTGRLTSEMVIKAAQMGIPFIVSRSGITQMGYEVAQRVGITLIGRAKGSHYLLFTGEHRFKHL